jgi:hypothetical protein
LFLLSVGIIDHSATAGQTKTRSDLFIHITARSLHEYRLWRLISGQRGCGE